MFYYTYISIILSLLINTHYIKKRFIPTNFWLILLFVPDSYFFLLFQLMAGFLTLAAICLY